MRVIVPPINVAMPTDSLNKIHAIIEAIIGSPIGVAATIVGDIKRIAKYIDPWPSIVGIIPKSKRPKNSYNENPIKDILKKIERNNSVIAAVENRDREKQMVLAFDRTFSEIINPIPRKTEHPTAIKLPIV